jgi:3-(3-hydroxy-phenyl)propionate hydroxylase
MMCALEIHYDLGPDISCSADGYPISTCTPLMERLFTLLHHGHAALLNFGKPAVFASSAVTDRVVVVDADYVGIWEPPVLVTAPAPNAVLIRPDGHVAWVGGGTDHGLPDALTTWFGCPTTQDSPPFAEATASLDLQTSPS